MSRWNLSSSGTFADNELEYPFASGQFRYVAKGMYTNGPRCNQPCVAKWFKSGCVFEDAFFEKDLKAVDRAQEFVDAWNSLDISNTIHLNRPEVWVWLPGSRWAGQKHLVEPFISDYTKFNSNTGWACNVGGWCEVMQALSHFSYHKSGGQMVLCDLQGGILSRGRGAVITDPVIMSRQRNYGVTDLGAEGISTFFARHRCNQYCQGHWQTPRNVSVHYKASAGTTMELAVQQHMCAGRQTSNWCHNAIYEEDDKDYSSLEEESDDY